MHAEEDIITNVAITCESAIRRPSIVAVKSNAKGDLVVNTAKKPSQCETSKHFVRATMNCPPTN